MDRMQAIFSGKFRKTLIACILLFLSGSNSFAQSTDQPQGIWFRKTNTPIGRFAYSQAILWPTSLAAHLYLYIREDQIGNLSQIYTLDHYRQTFTRPPVWDKDSLSWNYGVHPIMGSISYLAYRNKKAPWYEAVAGSAINSVIYEYIIAGGTQQPSINDMIVTPLLGSLLGEGLYRVKKRCLRDHRLNLFEKILITVTDPAEVFYYGFSYRKICRVDYR